MKRILILLIVLIGLTIESFAQCKIQTTHRPDNNTIKYFNPTPVIRQSGLPNKFETIFLSRFIHNSFQFNFHF
jgi:hypothetical protein